MEEYRGGTKEEEEETKGGKEERDVRREYVMRYPALQLERWGRERCMEKEEEKGGGARGCAGGGAGKRGSRMTPWPGTYGAPRLLGPTPDSQLLPEG